MSWPAGCRMVLGVALVALVTACGGPSPSRSRDAASLDAPEIKSALDGIQGSQIKQHMSVLADDAMEGRGLGTAGYESALRYVETTLRSYGLAPAGEAGGFRQRVPLRNSVVVEDASSMSVRSTAGKKTLVYGKDYLLGADALRDDVSIDDAPVVFVGLRRQRAHARLRRLRGRRGREGQGGGVPEWRAGDAAEQRARVLLVRRGEGGRGDHSAARSGRSASPRRTIRASAGT